MSLMFLIRGSDDEYTKSLAYLPKDSDFVFTYRHVSSAREARVLAEELSIHDKCVIMRGGLGCDSSLPTILNSAIFDPNDVIVVPTRVALDVPVNSTFVRFNKSPLELKEPDNTEQYITLDFLMGYAPVIADLLKDGWLGVQDRIRSCGYDVRFSTHQALYEVDEYLHERLLKQFANKDVLRSLASEVASIKKLPATQRVPTGVDKASKVADDASRIRRQNDIDQNILNVDEPTRAVAERGIAFATREQIIETKRNNKGIPDALLYQQIKRSGK